MPVQPVNATTVVDWLESSWKYAYHTPVPQAIEGLTADQAFWKPAPERHSIWQQVMHMAYWREYFASKLEGHSFTLDEAELQKHNWPAHPQPADEKAWQAAKERLAATQTRLLALLRAMPPEWLDAPPGSQPDARPVAEQVMGYIGHDSYHVGQIMLLRALQGLPPVE
ncbi:MAG: DinB family protein [Limnochordaceae bacterium]|nr:DinB family protein [Limnochordaceae bacterium]